MGVDRVLATLQALPDGWFRLVLTPMSDSKGGSSGSGVAVLGGTGAAPSSPPAAAPVTPPRPAAIRTPRLLSADLSTPLALGAPEPAPFAQQTNGQQDEEPEPPPPPPQAAGGVWEEALAARAAVVGTASKALDWLLTATIWATLCSLRLARGAPLHLATGIHWAGAAALSSLERLSHGYAAARERVKATGARAAGLGCSAGKAALGWLLQPAPTFNELTLGQLLAVTAAACLALAAAFSAGLAAADVSYRQAGTAPAACPEVPVTVPLPSHAAACSCPPVPNAPGAHAMPPSSSHVGVDLLSNGAAGLAPAELRSVLGADAQHPPAAAAQMDSKAAPAALADARIRQPARTAGVGNDTASHMAFLPGKLWLSWQAAAGRAAELAGGAVGLAGSGLDSWPTSRARFVAYVPVTVAGLIGGYAGSRLAWRTAAAALRAVRG
ncbi:hypothetical protein ABPG77_000821 [Micractinium sp. CCAP 211/92]